MDLVSFATLCALHGSPLLAPCPSALQSSFHSASSPALGHVDLAPWHAEIATAAQRFAIPKGWIGAVIAAESGGHTLWHGAPIVSSAGAMGLMQLMPKTYRAMQGRYGLGTDPFDPRDNILAGTAYLRRLYRRYGYPDLFAAYQAGPKRLEAWLDGRRPLPASTRAYLRRLIPGSDLAFGSGDQSPIPWAATTSAKTTNSVAKHASGGLFFMRVDASPKPESGEVASRSEQNSAPNPASPARASPPAIFLPLSQSQP